MQDITAKKQVVGFINMIKKTIHIVCILFLLGNISSCDDSRSVTQSIPTGPVNIVFDLNLSSYMYLSNPGEFAYFDGGIKGVLVIHDYDDNWYAFERSCAFEPSKTCSKIWADTMNLQFVCGEYIGANFYKCCDSKYNFQGFPTNAPAAGRLAQYKIQKDANIVQIYN